MKNSYQKGLKNNGKYNNSIQHLKRVQEIIPLGSQTFSKSFKQYPLGVSPLFIEKDRAQKFGM